MLPISHNKCATHLFLPLLSTHQIIYRSINLQFASTGYPNIIFTHLKGIFSFWCSSTITTSLLVHTILSSSIIRFGSTSASDSTNLHSKNHNIWLQFKLVLNQNNIINNNQNTSSFSKCNIMHFIFKKKKKKPTKMNIMF